MLRGEIRTPNLDALGFGGLRLTQMYNGARCCPSRAALLTGVHPHQAGIGQMTNDLGVPSYRGYLSERTATITEVLKATGCTTLMSGKWHVAGGWDNRLRDQWVLGDARHPLPRQRGFDRFFGLMNAADSYWNPKSLVLEDSLIDVESPGFHMTDAIAGHAVRQIDEAAGQGKPFFQYVAFTAPHWPLHAWEEDIARYEGRYMKGRDAVRTVRHERMKGLGIVDEKWPISPRDEDAPPWEDVRNKAYEDIRMAVYAAMVEQMDRGVEALQRHGRFENTLIFFMSDNGGCAELFQEDTDWPDPSQWETALTLDGQRVRVGGIPELRPGPDTTFQAVELPWANVSDTPFRLFKRWIHEGGIATPLIVHWPARIKTPRIDHSPAQIIDIASPIYEVTGAAVPESLNGHPVTPVEGESFLPLLEGRAWSREQPIFVEHEGNRGVRLGDWKLVAEWNRPWELYHMTEDRTELHDRAESEKRRVGAMSQMYEAWAERCGVLPWPVDPRVLAKRVKGKRDHMVQHRQPIAGRKFL